MSVDRGPAWDPLVDLADQIVGQAAALYRAREMARARVEAAGAEYNAAWAAHLVAPDSPDVVAGLDVARQAAHTAAEAFDTADVAYYAALGQP